MPYWHLVSISSCVHVILGKCHLLSCKNQENCSSYDSIQFMEVCWPFKFHCYGVISQCKRFSQTADVREACKALVRVWWFDPFEKHRNQLFWWRNCQWERLLLENVGNNSWFIAVSFQHVSDVVGFMCFPFVAAREVGCYCWCIWSFKIFFVFRVNFKKLGSSIRKLEMMKRYGTCKVVLKVSGF